MKKIGLLIMLQMLNISVNAQTLKQQVPKESKIYVLGPTHVMVDAALDELGRWGYWSFAKSKETADFVIYLYMDKRPVSYMDFNFSAEFRDKRDSIVYTTPTVNSVLPNGGVIKLIKKCIERKIDN